MSQDASSEPLLFCAGCAVVAIDIADGTIRWSVPTKQPVVRIYRVGARLFAVSGTTVVCIDVARGVAVGEVDVGFPADSGIVCGDELVLAHGAVVAMRGAIVCLTFDGRVKWRGTITMEVTGLLDGNAHISTVGPGGEPRGEARYPFRGGPAGLAYGAQVVQPDLEGNSLTSRYIAGKSPPPRLCYAEGEMRWLPSIVACLIASAPALARADDFGKPVAPPPPITVVHVDWASLDIGARPLPGTGMIAPLVLTGFELGPMSGAIDGAARGMSGDIGLTDRLTLHLVGFDDFFGTASAATVSVAWWMLERSSPFQIALSGGVMESSATSAAGRSAFAQIAGRYRLGSFEIAGSARVFGMSSGQSPLAPWDTRAGLAWRSGPFRVGAEGLLDGRGSRSAGLGPFVSATVPDSSITVRAGPVFRPKSRSATIGVGGSF